MCLVDSPVKRRSDTTPRDDDKKVLSLVEPMHGWRRISRAGGGVPRYFVSITES